MLVSQKRLILILSYLIHDFIAASDYSILNNEEPTYQNSIIDLTFAKGCCESIVNWSTFPEVFIRSDHNVIAFEIGTVPEIKSYRWRVNQADWMSWSRELDTVLQNLPVSLDPSRSSSDDVYDAIKKAV